MNEINFPSPENQWNGPSVVPSSGPYMQSSYTEYLGLPFKLEAGSNLANAQVKIILKYYKKTINFPYIT
jgi:hypothetical protein